MLKKYICKRCDKNLENIIHSIIEGYAIYEVIYDEMHNPCDYKYLEVNKQYEKMIGKSSQEIIGKTASEVFLDLNSIWMDNYNLAILTGEKVEFERYSPKLNKHFQVKAFIVQENRLMAIYIDITKHKVLEETLTMHKLLFESAHDAVLYIRDDGKVIEANDSASELYGYTYEELLKLTIHEIRHSSTRNIFDSQMVEADNGGIVFETKHVKKNGCIVPVEASVKGIMIRGERLRIHIIRDILKRKIAEEKIVYLANHDSLTGIPNRGYLMSELDKAIEQANRGGYKIALMLFDVDGFKKINDMYGHQAGDLVLKTIASRITNIIRKIDMIARLGGDEFIIILPMMTYNEESKLVKRMFKVLEQPILWGDVEIRIQISIGISVYPADATDKDQLIKLADEAMYHAKNTRGNAYIYYKKTD